MKALTVINAFAGHGVGDQITDAHAMADIASGEHSQHVVAVELPDPAEALPDAAPAIEPTPIPASGDVPAATTDAA